MPHQLLDRFDVGFVFAEPCAECMAEGVGGKMREKERKAPFFFREFCLFFIIRDPDPFDRTVHSARIVDVTPLIDKYKIPVSVDHVFTAAAPFLTFPQFIERVPHFLKHRDPPDSGQALGRADMHFKVPRRTASVDQRVINGDETVMKIDIAPPEAGQFSDAAAGSQKHSDHRQPVPVIVRFLQKPDQYTLLFLSKCPAAVP